MRDALLADGFAVSQGTVALPERPGLGVALDPAGFARRRVGP